MEPRTWRPHRITTLPSIGVLFFFRGGGFGGNIDGDSWFTWWFNHLPGLSICPKRTPMLPCLPSAKSLLVWWDLVGSDPY